MQYKTCTPLTVLYRGTLEDTATLVGLARSRAYIQEIVFVGDLTLEKKQYIHKLNYWLYIKNMPSISIYPKGHGLNFPNILNSPLSDWNWGPRECLTAIQLEGLPLPPRH